MKLTFNEYYDRVLGAWLGKCAGGIVGAPIEGIKAFNDIKLSKKLFEVNYPNDDLDLQLLWLDMVKKKGPGVRDNDFAEHWRNHVGFPWNEYGIATRNIRMGVYPPQSGSHNNYYYGQSMGCPIRSEIWGLLNPGDPEKAAFYAGMDAGLDHYGFSVDAEKFLSACISVAFLEKDITQIFKNALKIINKQSPMHQLVENILSWHKISGYKNARGKIKSFYGDADFTSAPMNIGFSLLVLLEYGSSFMSVIEALNMGHDSDCIAATCGALVGVISGYDKIPRRWKDLVGNELLVSREIVGIETAETITGLAEETCKAGILFIQSSKKIGLSGNFPDGFTTQTLPYHIRATSKSHKLDIAYENLTNKMQSIVLQINSKDIVVVESRFEAKVAPKKSMRFSTKFSHKANDGSASQYRIKVFHNSEKIGELKRGIAGYGSWLLIGPFIEDDQSLSDKFHPQFPEHGLSSLPSVQYMNHDKIAIDKNYLSARALGSIMKTKTWNKLPFGIQKIYPEDFRIELGSYYYGRGERTVYLVSNLTLSEDKELWIVTGCSCPFTMQINGKLVCKQAHTHRVWLGNNIVHQKFKKGTNTIILKLNLITDNNQLEFGFRDFTGKHPHQEQWSLLVPQI